MTTLRNISTLLILTISNIVNGQTFDKKFSGQWAMTSWTYEFHKDGTYKRTSSGHFGSPVYTGKYTIKSDTIHIITGFENTSGTLNEYYLLDKDSMLIDLDNFYDYSPNHKDWQYISKKRYDILKKPNMDSKNALTKKQFELKVNESTAILKKKRLAEITDEENFQIIRLINTIRMSQDSLHITGIYADFIKAVEKTGYEKEIASFYDWIPNRGMGFYFQKLQVELGGTPHPYSRYTIE
ncbi:hypothetical protein KJS94_02845 [Flavihumibacter rivuli]|uniref:hypothetical protein n=1 Tax=Flavihumibacter rivuli TaxID=2838156 RepID=UPI001BDE8A8C|nr:hypothetical protein [Flavihumibacter rivuli]ULQ57134.1 hypothetical protein KJS94_02845 [Flavihumibacter rivuli]